MHRQILQESTKEIPDQLNDLLTHILEGMTSTIPSCFVEQASKISIIRQDELNGLTYQHLIRLIVIFESSFHHKFEKATNISRKDVREMLNIFTTTSDALTRPSHPIVDSKVSFTLNHKISSSLTLRCQKEMELKDKLTRAEFILRLAAEKLALAGYIPSFFVSGYKNEEVYNLIEARYDLISANRRNIAKFDIIPFAWSDYNHIPIAITRSRNNQKFNGSRDSLETILSYCLREYDDSPTRFSEFIKAILHCRIHPKNNDIHEYMFALFEKLHDEVTEFLNHAKHKPTEKITLEKLYFIDFYAFAGVTFNPDFSVSDLTRFDHLKNSLKKSLALHRIVSSDSFARNANCDDSWKNLLSLLYGKHSTNIDRYFRKMTKRDALDYYEPSLVYYISVLCICGPEHHYSKAGEPSGITLIKELYVNSIHFIGDYFEHSKWLQIFVALETLSKSSDLYQKIFTKHPNSVWHEKFWESIRNEVTDNLLLDIATVILDQGTLPPEGS